MSPPPSEGEFGKYLCAVELYRNRLGSQRKSGYLDRLQVEILGRRMDMVGGRMQDGLQIPVADRKLAGRAYIRTT